MEHRAHIVSIKQTWTEMKEEQKEFVLASVQASIENIEMNFPRLYGSFLMEFIQNADDEQSMNMKIEIVGNTIRILNDGTPFSKKDVDGLCKVGVSKKKASEEYIGYFGVGFKSIFLISEHVEICSGGYYFKFDKNEFRDERMPWQVIPLWIENPTINLPNGCKTLFNIHIREPKLIEEIREEVKPIEAGVDRLLHNRLLLFLRKKLEHIEITDTEAKRRIKKLPKKSLISESTDYQIYSLEEYINDKLSVQECWLVFRSERDVPEDVKRDDVTKRWKKDKINKRETVVAFRLDEKWNLTKEEKGTAYFGVHSYMPLKDVKSGLNFLIQADFLTTPNRAALAPHCEWNEWLAKKIYQLIEEKCIQSFKNNDKWGMNFTDILYAPWGGDKLFEDNIKGPLRKYLEEEDCFVAADRSFISLKNAVSIDPKIRELLSDKDLKELYPDRKPLHPDCKLPTQVTDNWQVVKGPNYDSRGINSEMERLLKVKAGQNDIGFFKQFYLMLLRDYPSTLRSGFSNQKIILTDSLALANAGSAYIKPAGIDVLEEIRENFNIVHPEISSDASVVDFLNAIGVEKLTEGHIQDILKTKELPYMSEKWPHLSDEEKIGYIRLYKSLWKERKLDLKRDLNFLTLKTKSGRWLKPEEIIFPRKYMPDHNLESLVGKDWLKDIPVEFLSEEFIEGDAEIWDWANFFKEVEVDKKTSDKNFISRIGILMALRYEESKGRNASELSRSAETGGYDILSEEEGDGFIGSERRVIEVKSSRSRNPDIPLSLNQSKALTEREDQYYVYVVKDVLTNPTLCVTRGDILINIVGKMTIRFNDWDNIKEDVFTCE